MERCTCPRFSSLSANQAPSEDLTLSNQKLRSVALTRLDLVPGLKLVHLRADGGHHIRIARISNQQPVHLEVEVLLGSVEGGDEVGVGRLDFAVRHQQHVRVRPPHLLQPPQRAPQRLVHVRPAVEGHGEEEKEALHRLGRDGELHLLAVAGAAEGVHVARPRLLVRLAEALEHERLGHRLARTHHGAGGVEADDDGPPGGARPHLRAGEHARRLLHPPRPLVRQQRALREPGLEQELHGAGPRQQGGLGGHHEGEVARAGEPARLAGLEGGPHDPHRPPRRLRLRRRPPQRALAGAAAELADEVAQLLEVRQLLAQRLQLQPPPLLPQPVGQVEAQRAVHQLV
mmetsp:Transcript_36973/g.80544  ORF Transcript_36973/g.80544 Transcript_36973/m.80544 type:complete len:344 (-) Transcript_36973:1277-2308(-)